MLGVALARRDPLRRHARLRSQYAARERLADDVVVLAAYKHITNPECRQYMLRQSGASCAVTIERAFGLDYLEIFEDLMPQLPELQYVVTVGDGSFRLPPLAQGAYRLEIRLPGGKADRKGSEAIENLLEHAGRDLLVVVSASKLEKSAQKAGWVKAVENQGAVVQVWPVGGRELPGVEQQRQRPAGDAPAPTVSSPWSQTASRTRAITRLAPAGPWVSTSSRHSRP